METKKTWENAPSALIPEVRLSHCPLVRISNESLPTSAEIYAYTTANVVPPETAHLWIHVSNAAYIRKDSTPMLRGVHLIIYIKGMLAAGRYKIYPRRRSLLHHRCIKIQSCEV